MWPSKHGQARPSPGAGAARAGPRVRARLYLLCILRAPPTPQGGQRHRECPSFQNYLPSVCSGNRNSTIVRHSSRLKRHGILGHSSYKRSLLHEEELLKDALLEAAGGHTVWEAGSTGQVSPAPCPRGCSWENPLQDAYGSRQELVHLIPHSSPSCLPRPKEVRFPWKFSSLVGLPSSPCYSR